jgi:hypothetical protein
MGLQVLRIATHQANCNMSCMQVRPSPVGRPILSLAADVRDWWHCISTYCRSYPAALAFDVILLPLLYLEEGRGVNVPWKVIYTLLLEYHTKESAGACCHARHYTS